MAYTIVVLPLSIVRWITFNDAGLPTPAASAATAVAVSIFNLSGLTNVVLILATRTNVLLFGSHGVIPINEAEERNHVQMQEGGTGEGHRRWARRSADVPVPDMCGSSLDAEGTDTGFGGPRVRLGREDEDDEMGGTGGSGFERSSVGDNRGRHSVGKMPTNGPAFSSNLSEPSGSQPRPRTAPNASTQELPASRAPGRAYLESL
jgi:hypothetical protein